MNLLRRIGLPVLVVAVLAATVGAPVSPRRVDVVRAARGELGKSDPTPYINDALGYPSTDHYQWCGMFALWSLHRAGLALDWHWEPSIGFVYRLPITTDPQPADIAVYKWSATGAVVWHHAVVEFVDRNAGTVTVINGNGAGGQVTRSTRPISDATAYYSTEPLFVAARSGL